MTSLARRFCALLGVWLAVSAASPTRTHADPAPSTTSQVVRAADTFLATLDDGQRAKVLYKFDDNAQRARWSNFPTGFVPRGGINLQQMSEPQRAAALALMATVLSPKGFEKMQQIREADEAFKKTDHGPPPFARDHGGDHHGPPPGQDQADDQGGPHPGTPRGDHGGPAPASSPGGSPTDDQAGNHDHPPFGDDHDHSHGGPPPGGFPPGGPGGRGPNSAMFGQDLYYISFLGTPSETAPWMLQFGGHHLALNITIDGERGVLTPTLTGAQPATFTTADGRTVRPIGAENDGGFALLHALDDTQRAQAILKYRVADLVLGPGHDGQTIQPEGLKASAMNEAQRQQLLDLISVWTGIVNDQYAAPRLAEIKAGLDETYFAWSGPTEPAPGKQNGTAYYRIQGPKLVIEFAPQHEEDHVHTMYRDPTNDYGRALTAAK